MHKAGKLIKVAIACTDRIEGIRISGDFFMHPEESIEDLENALLGAPLAATEIRSRIKTFLQKEVSVFGFDADSLTEAVMKAADSASECGNCACCSCGGGCA